MINKSDQPWSRRPWPSAADDDETALYAAVGLALSDWERYETVLAILFATFVSPFDSYPARRAYSSVRTFEGRLSMLKAASSTYFEAMPSPELQEKLKNIVTSSNGFSQRRNDIAHGVVDEFRLQKTIDGEVVSSTADGYALFPSITSYQNRDHRGNPDYCMTSSEISYFSNNFMALAFPAIELQRALGEVWNKEIASRYTRIEQDLP